MKNIMLDLETMGVSANSAIVAIGAVDDAEYQAKYLIELVKKNKLTKIL